MNIRRILTMLVMLVLIATLTGCNKSVPNTISLKVFNYFEIDSRYYNSDLKEPKLIQSHDEYLEILGTHNFPEGEDPFKEEFFDESSIYIVPVLSNKFPDFEIRNFEFDDTTLKLVINQFNNLGRFPGDESLSTYFLGIEINTKEIKNVDFEMVEKNKYYKHFNFSVNMDFAFNFEDNYVFIKNYSDYIETFNELPKYMDIVQESTFDNYIVLAYYIPSVQSGNYTVPIDLYINDLTTSGEIIQKMYLDVQIAGKSASLVYEGSLSIFVIEKSDIVDPEILFEANIK